MFILIEFTALTYKMWHYLCCRLKEVNPDIRFGALLSLGAGGEYVERFLKEQHEIDYIYVGRWHEMRQNALSQEIDWQLLRKFEESTQYKSLWRIISADRTLSTSYMHGAVWTDSVINSRCNKDREIILKIFSGVLKSYQQLFEKYKPDIHLPAPAQGGIEAFIMEQLCRDYKTLYAVPTTCRIEDYFAYVGDMKSNFDGLIKAYREYENNGDSADLNEGRKLYNKLVSDFQDNQFFDRKNSCFKIKKLETLSQHVSYGIKSFVIVLKIAITWILDWKKRGLKDVRRLPNTFKAFWEIVNIAFWRRYNNWRYLLNPKFGTILPKRQKYLYFPLHMTPEYSTQVQGTMWLNQLHLIEALAKSIPSDWVVYVKEHPATLKYRTRPPDFYRKLQSYPNIFVAPIDMDMNDIISNAQMVAVITGTSGWEAILRGIPVINFGDCMWDVMDLAHRCTTLENLPNEIHAELSRIETISNEERELRITRFLTGVVKHGFRMTYAQQYSFNAPATEDHWKHIGSQMADALVNHYEYLREIPFKNSEKKSGQCVEV